MAADRRFTEPRKFGTQASAKLTGTRLNWSKTPDGADELKADESMKFPDETNMLNKQGFSATEFQTKFRPPYAPKLSEDEMKILTEFLQEKEERLIALENDPMYQFCISVAGLSNRDLDGVLVFPTKDHFMPFSDTKIPSTGFEKDVVQQRQEINKAIVEKTMELEELITRSLLINQIAKTARVESPGGPVLNEAGTAYLSSAIDLFSPPNNPVINRVLTRMVPRSPEFRKVFLRYMKYRDTVVEYFTRDLQIEGFDVVKPRFESAVRGLGGAEIFEQDMIRLFPSKALDTSLFDDFFATEENTAEDYAVLKAQRELEDLKRYEAQLKPSSSRERMYAALKWAGRPEVVPVSNLTPVMKGAITLSLSKLRAFAPQFRNVTSDIVKLVGESEDDFVSLLAKLVALHILETETEAPTRTTLDMAEHRLARKINKLMFALKKFVVTNGKVVGYNPRASRLSNAALYAYPGGGC